TFHMTSNQCGPRDLFQMPVGDLHVVITLGQDFALFGQSQGAIDRLGRKRQNTSCRRTAASTERTAAAVKEGEFHAPLLRDLVQGTLCFVQPPARREISAVLGTV